jgi:hypothetical protein
MNNAPQHGDVMLVDNFIYVYSTQDNTWHPAPQNVSVIAIAAAVLFVIAAITLLI